MKLSHGPWTFLTLTLAKSKDRAAFDNAKPSQGLDAWRRLVVPIGPRSDQRLHEMHNAVIRPVRSKKVSDLEKISMPGRRIWRSTTGVEARR